MISGYSISIPSFHRKSYLSYHLPRLFPNALTVSITFKLWAHTDAEVYSVVRRFRNKQKYLKIHVVDGYVVLKYDLGDGVVVVKADSRKVTVGKWIKVYVEQKKKHASLSIDDEQAYKGFF